MQFNDFAFAYGAPAQRALFRSKPEDFVVTEVFDEAFSGEGEHFWLKIKKRGENTDWIAGKLAEYFSVKRNDVGYAGKKDRHAVTTQWFSVYMPGREHSIDWQAFLVGSEVDAELLDQQTHSKKLKIGQHQGNHFRITLREIDESSELLERLENIQKNGVPNYFGEQRFGRDFSNIEKVKDWVAAPQKRLKRSMQGMIYSAARSFLFNQVLSERIGNSTWQVSLDGETLDHPSGPLWGRGRLLVSGETESFETKTLEPFADWCNALEHVGLSQERRSLVLKPKDFAWSFEDGRLVVTMSLGSGQYATTALRELVVLENAAYKNEGA